jgi:hypothetical protein
MSAARLISDLHRQGFTLSVNVDKLIVEGPVNLMTDALKAELTRHKPALLLLCRVDWARRASHLLSKINDPDHRADLRFQFEERASVYEYDGNLTRDEAERLAYLELAKAVEGGNREE